MSEWTVIESDCIEAMRAMAEASVDAIVTDPPYGLGFMGKEWDTIGDTGRGARARTERAAEVTPTGEGHSTSAGPYLAAGVDSLRSAGRPFQAWCEAWARESLRVLKPGGHLLAFGGTRTSHRLVCAIEDAGFEIRDSLLWLYGSGFPKSLDVSKAIDKASGAEREVVGRNPHEAVRGAQKPMPDQSQGVGYRFGEDFNVTAPATPDAAQWHGWGTALKPAHEPIVLARKPLVGTVAGNVLEHGTGALNVDGCRIENTPEDREASMNAMSGDRMWRRSGITGAATFDPGCAAEPSMNPAGRWPANVLLDEEAAALLDEQTGKLRTNPTGDHPASEYSNGHFGFGGHAAPHGGDSGGASRFFYCAKAGRDERNAGLEGFPEKTTRDTYGDGLQGPRPHTADDYEWQRKDARNVHPTVKPIDLMRWLCRLVTPPGGTVLDPFTGSGTTGCAAVLEDFNFIGIEREAEYVAIATARIAHWWAQPVQLGLEAA